MSHVLAAVIGDIHLTHNPPTSRSSEENWYETQRLYLSQVKKILNKLDNPPLLVSGDIFDLWFGAIGKNASTLINFAMRNFPKSYAIPGQHDLPFHRIEGIKDTAYWTLVETKVIKNLEEETVINYYDYDLIVYPFPWGAELKPCPVKDDNAFKIAICHHYAFLDKKTSYPGAPDSGNIKKLKETLKGYDFVIFGDNHKQWKKGSWANCGSFMCRKKDEINHTPAMALLYSDKTIEFEYLDVTNDNWSVDEEEFITSSIKIEGLFPDIETYSDDLDFQLQIENIIEHQEIKVSVAKILKAALGIV